MKSFEKITTHLQTTGYIYQGSQIYGGLSNTRDYGPLGSQLKKNLKDAWWKSFVLESKLNVGIDSAILMNPKVWEATGHVSTFNDPLIDCKSCKERYRADELVGKQFPNNDVSKLSISQLNKFIKDNHVVCPSCGKSNFTDIRQFNMMFKTHIGVTEDSKSEVYLRPETAQGVFVNFKNVQRSTRKKIPFGIANVGKAFRNEITPGNFTFRTREFEQLELEFFCKPGEDIEWFVYWREFCSEFLISLGLNKAYIRYRDHEKEELAFYSLATTDLEYKFPFGWGEIWGIADRTDYDLKRHQRHSGESLEYLDPDTQEKYVPYCIEPSLGLDRLFLAIVCDAYDEEELENGEIRKIMHLKPSLAPFKVAVLPLSKQLNKYAEIIYEDILKHFPATFDTTGSIGKRYRRNDEIGTPFCITVDFQSEEDETVTIRYRDTMKQKRIKVSRIINFLKKNII